MFNKRIILTSIVMLVILSGFAAGRWLDPIGLPSDEGGEELPPKITYDSTLKIIEVNAEIDGKKDTITSNGEKISEKAKEESKLEFEVEVKNIFGKELKNIKLEVTIEDIDDGGNLDEDSDISKLAPGESKKVNVAFELPLKVDDGSYDVKIHAEGKDQDNNLHILDWTLTLEVKKDSHNVEITKASLSPSTVSCSTYTNLEVGILNLGRDEEKAQIEVKNEYLNINLLEKGIELGTGTDNDAEYQKTFRLDMPYNAEAGTYPITINAYYNGGKSLATKKVNLAIKGCTQTGQKQRGVSVKGLPPTPSEKLGKLQTKTPSKTIISTASDESIILLLTIILIVVLGLIIFLLGVIITQLRR